MQRRNPESAVRRNFRTRPRPPRPHGANEITYDGVHCNLLIQRYSNRVVLLRISGTDIGEFGDAPMSALSGWIQERGTIDLYIDAHDVRGASIEVSGEWAAWLRANKDALRSFTMLTGSKFIQITAEFVRRFAGLEGIMRICCDPAVFDDALAEAVATH